MNRRSLRNSQGYAPGHSAVEWSGAGEGWAQALPTTRWDPLLIAIAVTMMTTVWRIQDIWPVLAQVQLPTLAAVSAYGLFLIDKDPRRRLSRIRHPVVVLVTAILILMLLSVPGGVYPGLSFRFVFKDHVKTFLLLILVAGSVRSREDVERLTIVQLAGAVMYSVVVMTRIEIGQSGRLGDLYYYDANDLGLMLVATMPAAVFFLRNGQPLIRRVLALPALGIVMLALLKSGSRGGFLGFIGVVAFLVVRFSAIPKRVRVGAVTAMIAVMLVAASDQYWKTMSTLLHPTEDYNWSGKAEVGRMEVWKRGIGYMMSNPILGVGANAFPIAEGTLSPLAGRQDVGIGLKWSAAHNSFVQIGAELGVVGLILFVVLLVRTGQTLGRLGRIARGQGGRAPPEVALAQTLAAALVGYCIAGFFLSQAYSALLYSVLGMVVGLAKLAPMAAHAAARPSGFRSVQVPGPYGQAPGAIS